MSNSMTFKVVDGTVQYPSKKICNLSDLTQRKRMEREVGSLQRDLEMLKSSYEFYRSLDNVDIQQFETETRPAVWFGGPKQVQVKNEVYGTDEAPDSGVVVSTYNSQRESAFLVFDPHSRPGPDWLKDIDTFTVDWTDESGRLPGHAKSGFKVERADDGSATSVEFVSEDTESLRESHSPDYDVVRVNVTQERRTLVMDWQKGTLTVTHAPSSSRSQVHKERRYAAPPEGPYPGCIVQ